VAFYNGPTADGSRPGVYYVNLADMNQVLKAQTEGIAYRETCEGWATGFDTRVGTMRGRAFDLASGFQGISPSALRQSKRQGRYTCGGASP
jgi:hypothetical protein